MARLDRQSISLLAEKLGERRLSPDIEEFLNDYIETKVREILEVSGKFKRQSHRTQLQAKDLRRAMRQLNLETLYGFPAWEPLVYRQCDKADEWVLDDPIKDLGEVMEETEVETPMDVTLHSHWLLINGLRPDIPENQVGLPTEISSNQLSSSDDPKVITSVTHQLSNEQQLYYNAFLTSLSRGDHFAGFRESLASDSSLGQLVPYLTRSLYTITMETNDLGQLDRAMDLMGALCSNPYLNIEAYLHQVMPALLSGLLRSGLTEDQHWAYRRKSALIIASVVNRYMETFEDLKQRTLEFLATTVLDKTRKLDTVYGAVYGIVAFGCAAVHEIIIPNIEELLERSEATGLEGFQGSHLQSALIDACRAVLPSKPELRQSLESLFGDQLIPIVG